MDKREKKCSKCGEVKAVREFTKDKAKKDGFHSSCKECHKEYYLKNRERLLNNMRQRSKTLEYKENRKKYESQPEVKAKIKEYDKFRKVRDRDKIIARMKKYNSREEVKKRKQKWGRKEEVVKRRRESQANDRLIISDSYAKNLINKQSGNILKADDIPQELIELKRNNLILKRKIKENGKEATNL